MKKRIRKDKEELSRKTPAPENKLLTSSRLENKAHDNSESTGRASTEDNVGSAGCDDVSGSGDAESPSGN